MKLPLATALIGAAMLITTGPNSPAKAQAVNPDFVSAMGFDDAEVAQKCNFPRVFAKVVINQDGGTESDGSFVATASTTDGGGKVFVDDQSSDSSGGAPDQFRDLTADGGMEAVVVKFGTFFSLFCFINANEALVTPASNRQNSAFNQATVYWRSPLCLSTVAHVNAVCGDVNADETLTTGFVFHLLGGNTEQLACGCGSTVFLACDEGAPDKPTNFQCIPPNSTFANSSAESNVNVNLPPQAAGPALQAVETNSLEDFAAQFCSSQSGGSNTTFLSCMAAFGF